MPLFFICFLLIVGFCLYFFGKDSPLILRLKNLLPNKTLTEENYPKPAVVDTLWIEDYYFSDENGVWFKNTFDDKPELIFSSDEKIPANQMPEYKYQVLDYGTVLAMYSIPYVDSKLYECVNNGRTHDCTAVDNTYTFYEDKPLIRKIPGENAYVYLRKLPEKLGWFGDVYAQMPYNIEVVKRNYENNTSEVIAQIVQEVGCGGGSWHTGYYHGYRRDMMITTTKLAFLQLGCEGYPGNTSQYVIDINKKQTLPGNWHFISPVQMNDSTVLFHRVVKIPTQSGKPQKSEHVFYTAPLNDLTNETELLHFGSDNFVADFVYHEDRKRIYISYIHEPDPYQGNKINDFDLRIAEIDPQKPEQLRDIYKTKGYYMSDLMLSGDMLIFTSEFQKKEKSAMVTDYYTNLFDLSKNEIEGSVDKKIFPRIGIAYSQ